MLVLSRKKDEVIVIGDDIRITVVEIRGDKVRLGISAPREVSVHREEVYQAIHGAELRTDKDGLAIKSDTPKPVMPERQ